MTTIDPSVATIKAQLANTRQRLQLLPKYFGRLMIVAENTIHAQLARLSADYQGGYWHFYELSNGGFYMAPDDPEKLTLSCAENYFDGELSADGAGIVACLLAFNRLYCKTRDSRFAQLEQCLKDYAAIHSEAKLIFGAID